MIDPLPRNYDAWRTRSQEDEDEERAEQWRREQRAIDKAEHDRDRRNDEDLNP